MRSMARRGRKSRLAAVKRKPSTSSFALRLKLSSNWKGIGVSSAPGAGVLRGGASAPKKVGREPHSKQDDRCRKVLELRRIAERQVHGVTDDGSSRKDKENRRPGISRNAIRERLTGMGAANGKDGGSSQP